MQYVTHTTELSPEKMTELINSQRKVIAYYTKLRDKEQDRKKRHLLNMEIMLSEQDLNRMLKSAPGKSGGVL